MDHFSRMPQDALFNILNVENEDGESLFAHSIGNLQKTCKLWDFAVAKNPCQSITGHIESLEQLESLGLWVRRPERFGNVKALEISVGASAESGFAEFMLDLTVSQPNLEYLNIEFVDDEYSAGWPLPSDYHRAIFAKLHTLALTSRNMRNGPPIGALHALIGPATRVVDLSMVKYVRCRDNNERMGEVACSPLFAAVERLRLPANVAIPPTGRLPAELITLDIFDNVRISAASLTHLDRLEELSIGLLDPPPLRFWEGIDLPALKLLEVPASKGAYIGLLKTSRVPFQLRKLHGSGGRQPGASSMQSWTRRSGDWRGSRGPWASRSTHNNMGTSCDSVAIRILLDIGKY